MTNLTVLSPDQLRHLECINQAWAKSLAGWRDSVEGIIATGKALTAAKNELKKDFKPLLKEPEFPFGERMVQMLEKVAEHPVLSDETCFAALPPAWGTLHALTQLSDKAIKKGLADGTINPRMERKDVAKLMPPKKCDRAGCSRPVHRDGYCDEHYVAPEPLSAYDQIIPVLERFKDELKADLNQSRKLAEWLRDNVDEALFKSLAEDLDQEAEAENQASSAGSNGTVVIELPASPEPTPVFFDNPEDEPVPPVMVQQSPPTAPAKPYVADTRTADEIMGDLPEELRRRRERAEQLAAWHRRTTP